MKEDAVEDGHHNGQPQHNQLHIICLGQLQRTNVRDGQQKVCQSTSHGIFESCDAKWLTLSREFVILLVIPLEAARLDGVVDGGGDGYKGEERHRGEGGDEKG